jgi:cell division transport system permease protein
MQTRRSAFSLRFVGGLLPWLMAFMVYLGALAVAGFLIVQQVTTDWERSMGGSVTVQLPPGLPPSLPPGGAGADGELASALDILRATPGVASAEPVSDDEMLALLSPWLDGAGLPQDLPLPRLIDVRLEPDASVDVHALQERLEHRVPAALVDNHGRSLAALRGLTTTIKAVSAAFIASIVLLAMGTVFVVTRAGIGIHGDTLEVLHLIGADESFVARAFTAPVLKQALLGGLIGCAAAIASLLALERLTADLLSGTLFAPRLAPAHWAAVFAVPLVLAALTLITARVTVHRFLAARA